MALGLVGLIDAKGINVAQPIWLWDCPTSAQNYAKGYFSTNWRPIHEIFEKNIENWRFWKSQLFWVCHFDFFALFPWKEVKVYWLARVGQNFDQAKHDNIFWTRPNILYPRVVYFIVLFVTYWALATCKFLLISSLQINQLNILLIIIYGSGFSYVFMSLELWILNHLAVICEIFFKKDSISCLELSIESCDHHFFSSLFEESCNLSKQSL